jgi:HSP20 family protein
MRLTYDPWNVLNQFYKDLDQVYVKQNKPSDDEDSTIATSAWVPAIDIQEEEQRFLIYADLPGVDPNIIEVSMEKGILTIKGERPSISPEDSKLYKRVERRHGTFYRRFSLPDSVDIAKIAATSKHGVLEITIPKREAEQPRKISVEG